MNRLNSIALLAILALGSVAQPWQELTASPELNEKEKNVSAIAESTRQGVTVCIDQIQIQRIGTNVELVKRAAQFGIDKEKFARTITLSISKKNCGKSSGPISLTLKNGTTLTPMLVGNQKFMSAIANSGPTDGFDFEENWFELPHDTKLDQIFPVSISFRCTDKTENAVQFELANIYP